MDLGYQLEEVDTREMEEGRRLHEEIIRTRKVEMMEIIEKIITRTLYGAQFP